MNNLRILFAAYCIATYFLALVISGVREPGLGESMLIGMGLVMYIIALGGLLIGHRTERRPVRDLILITLYPVAAYVAVTGSTDLHSGAFWMFLGYMYFAGIAGGFALGLLCSPFFAAWGKLPARAVLEFVKGVFQVFSEFAGAGLFLLALFGGTLAALVYAVRRLLGALPGLTAAQQAVFFALLALESAAVVWFTYRHTSFGIVTSPRMRKAYREMDSAK